MSLRSLRESAGLTQAQLASRAGVSRQLVGAAEAGRHLPRVDAALAMAAVLGVDVAVLFASAPPPVDVASGATPADGSPVRAGRVGEQVVTAAARIGPDGWDVADAVVEDGTLTGLGQTSPGLVVAGCEPGLVVLERMLRERGMGAVAVSTSSAVAAAALGAGRAHAAVVHGPRDRAWRDVGDVERFHLARWQVGLAAPADAPAGWAEIALSGRVAVVQREDGAGVQRAFEQAAGGPVAGPRVRSHLEAARRAVLTGMAAVTIEPAALAVGAAFHAVEVHAAQLLVGREWLGERAIGEALAVVAGSRFQRRLLGVGGYDLAGCGTRAA